MYANVNIYMYMYMYIYIYIWMYVCMYVGLVSEWSKAPLVGSIRLKLMMPRGSAQVQSRLPPDTDILSLATSDITTSLLE